MVVIPATFIGPEGVRLNRSDLPPSTARWTKMRKATVVCAIRANVLTAAEAASMYSLSMEELSTWPGWRVEYSQAAASSTETRTFRPAPIPLGQENVSAPLSEQIIRALGTSTMTRSELLKSLNPDNSSMRLAKIDAAMRALVRDDVLQQPSHGAYRIASPATERENS